ncbi:MAG: NAD(P)H-dependent oxidoreductase subunit E [Candidatus Zixiibacteriota bacterium]
MQKTTLSEKTIKLIDEVPKGREDLIIPVLQDIQGIEGYIPEESIIRLSNQIDTTPARIFGVVTFYNQFRTVPLGKHIIRVCRGTACHVKGSGKLLSQLVAGLDIEPGGTTEDGLFTVEEVACLGACSIAPAVMVDDKFYGHMTSEGIMQLVEALRAGGKK